jgi:hypothetical protein
MNDRIVSAAEISKPEPLIKKFMTQSTIYDRHRRRRENTLAKQGDNRAPMARVLSQVPVFNQVFLPYHQEDTVFTTTVERSRARQPSTPLVLVSAAFAGAGTEFLFGRPSQPTKVSQLFATIQTSGTIALQQETVLRNQQRAMRMAFAAGSASILFGTKQMVANDDHDSVLSSAVAGGALATIYTPLLNTKTHMTIYRIPSFSDAAMSLMRSQSLFQNAPRVYSREVAGAVVLFGTYETLKGNKDPSTSTSILASGAMAGALYKSITFHFEVNQQQGMPLLRGFAPAVARAIPAYMVLFMGYESALTLSRP